MTLPAKPIASANSETVAAGTSIPLSTLFSYSAASGDSIVGFDVEETSSGSGYLTLNGVKQSAGILYGNSEFGIPISQIGQWAFVAGTAGTVDSIGFNVDDQYGQFNPTVTATVSAQASQLPSKPTATANSQAVAAGTSIPLSTLFSYSAASADSIVGFDVEETSSGSGYLTLNGVKQSAGILYGNSEFGIPIGQIGQWAFVAGTAGTVDSIGFNVDDQYGQFNPTVTATVSAQGGGGGSTTQYGLDYRAVQIGTDANGDPTYQYYNPASYNTNYGYTDPNAYISPTDIATATHSGVHYSFAMEYIGEASSNGYLRPSDVAALEAAGFSIVSIYERSPLSVTYFTQSNADADAANSIAAASAIGQTAGSTADESAILAYFEEIQKDFVAAGSPYKIGVYADGNVLNWVSTDTNLSSANRTFLWLAYAPGWPGSSGYSSEIIQQNYSTPITIGSNNRNVDLDIAYTSNFGQWGNDIASTPPTLSVSSDGNATRGQALNLSSLVTISDPGDVGYTKLELWDSNGTVAGGQFVVGGVAQTGGHEIDVTPANFANTVFDVGTLGGTDALWARLLESDGTLTSWQSFTVTAPQATHPSLTVSNDPSASQGQTVALSNLVTVSDPDSIGYQTLQLWDTDGTVAGGEFMINGVAQTGGHAINVPSGANVAFDAGTGAGTDTLWAQLIQNDGSASGWEKFTVTVPAPTVSATSVPTAIAGQQIALANLVTVSDPSGATYELQLWDSDGTTAGGEFLVNGVAQTGGHAINVPSGATVVFDAGTRSGTDTLWAQLIQSNGSANGWQEFTVTVPTPTISVSSISNATGGEAINLSSLVTITNPGNVAYQTLQLWDTDGTAAGGEFLINGTPQTGGHAINVPSGANVVFDAGTGSGIDTLWAQLIQSNGAASGWEEFSVTVPNPTLAVHNDTTATPAQVINLSNLVTITDPGVVGYQKLELWDSNGTATTGQFMVDGVAQTGGHEIDVSPANVANTVFDEGTSGNTDTLWAQLELNNGSLTGWEKFTVIDPVTVAQGATFELTGPYAGEAIFAGTAGTLQLDSTTGFTGTVAGMTGQDTLDLRDIGFGATTTLGFAENSSGTGGTLSVSDGRHTANIALLGHYMASTFVASSDGHGGTAVVEPSLIASNQQTVLTQPLHA